MNIMERKPVGSVFWLCIALAVFAVDQLSKLWILETFHPFETLDILPFFSLTLTFNPGAAFSFLGDQSGWQRWFLIAVALGVSVVLIRWIRQLGESDPLQSCALALILGGAIGNVLDRLMTGVVTDFLLFYYQDWYFPAFNVADIAITTGAGLMILELFIKKESTDKPAPNKP